jgi:hypothetical protein
VLQTVDRPEEEVEFDLLLVQIKSSYPFLDMCHELLIDPKER